MHRSKRVLNSKHIGERIKRARNRLTYLYRGTNFRTIPFELSDFFFIIRFNNLEIEREVVNVILEFSREWKWAIRKRSIVPFGISYCNIRPREFENWKSRPDFNRILKQSNYICHISSVRAFLYVEFLYLLRFISKKITLSFIYKIAKF